MELRDAPKLALRLFLAGFVLAFLLGYWGWLIVGERHGAGTAAAEHLAHHFLGRVYLTMQLFVLHPQELPESYPAPLDVARLLAPIVLLTFALYVLATIFGSGLRVWLVGLSRKHVIVCGAGVHGTRICAKLVDGKPRTPVLLLDVNPRAPGFRGRPRLREARLVADTLNDEALGRAGVRRAARVIAVTGDDVLNAQIASAVRRLSRSWNRRPDLLVQAEDPTLARFLEDGAMMESVPSQAGDVGRAGQPAGHPGLETFGANALAAAGLFGRGPYRPATQRKLVAPLTGFEHAPEHQLLLAGDHDLLEAIVVTALRRGRARRLRLSLSRIRRPMRITLVDPGAETRRDELASRWQLDPTVIDLRAVAVDLRTERSALAGRSWDEWRSGVFHAIVVSEDEQASIATTVTLSRLLGPTVGVTRVTTLAPNELDKQLESYADLSKPLAPIAVVTIADLAWGPDNEPLTSVTPAERLAAALRFEHYTPKLAHDLSEHLLEQTSLAIRSDAAPRMSPATAPIAAGLLGSVRGALPPVPVRALVAAGLTLDLDSPSNLCRAAEQLTLEGRRDAFSAWCEVTRLAGAASQSPPPADATTSVGATIHAPVLLGAATHGSCEALGAVGADAETAAAIAGRDSRRIAILAGGAATMSDEAVARIRALLARALYRYDGMIITGGNDVGIVAAVRRAATENGVPLLGYAPSGRGMADTWLRETAAGEFSEAEPVAMWADVLAAAQLRRRLTGAAADVRVVAFPGGRITHAEMVLARALGAEVAFLDPCQDQLEPLDDVLPFGAGGVIALPDDPMTLRAFLMRPNTELDPDRREAAARELHEQYRREHVRHKAEGDPALAQWERLSPTLQRSNLAAVDDIPNKLHVLGKRLVVGGGRLALDRAELELLAEMEHGRYNHERLSTGWELGRTRQITRLVSPYLTPWRDLEDSVKQWDRDTVGAIDEAIHKAGWGVIAAERR